MATRTLPAPEHTPETAAFVAAAREGRFVLPHCRACGRTHWYPRAVCPHCWATPIEWRAASGLATVYSHSTLLRTDAPYTLAYVTLAEGTTMLTHLVDAPSDGWRIGQAVRLRFVPAEDGTPVAVFAPA
jgi:uncharacterized OB-fold protein